MMNSDDPSFLGARGSSPNNSESETYVIHEFPTSSVVKCYTQAQSNGDYSQASPSPADTVEGLSGLNENDKRNAVTAIENTNLDGHLAPPELPNCTGPTAISLMSPQTKNVQKHELFDKVSLKSSTSLQTVRIDLSSILLNNQSELFSITNERSEPHLEPKLTSLRNKTSSRGILRVKEKRTSWDELIQRCMRTLSTYVPTELLLEEALKVFGLICFNEFFMGGCEDESCLLEHYNLPDITKWDWPSVWMATLYVIRYSTKPKIEILKMFLKFISGRAPIFALGLATCIAKMRQREQLEFAGYMVNRLEGFFGRETAVMLVLFITYPVVGTELFNILLERLDVFENDSTIYLDLLNFLNFRIHVLPYTLVEKLIRDVLPLENNDLVGIVGEFLDRLTHIEKRKIMGTSLTRFMNKISECSKDEIESRKRLIGTKGSIDTKTENPTCLDLPNKKRVSFTEHPLTALISDGDHTVTSRNEYHQPSQPSPNNYIMKDFLLNQSELLCVENERSEPYLERKLTYLENKSNSRGILSVKEKRTSWDELIQRCMTSLNIDASLKLLLNEALRVFKLICYNEFFMGGCEDESCLLEHYKLPNITKRDWSSVWMATLYVIRMATKPKIEFLNMLVKFFSGPAPILALSLATCIPKMRQREQLEFAGCVVNHLAGFIERETAVMLVLFITYPVVGTELFNILLVHLEVFENDSTIYLDLLNFLNFRIHVLPYTLVEKLIGDVLSSENNDLVGIIGEFLDRLPHGEKRKIMGTSLTRFMNKISECSMDEIESRKRLIGTMGSINTKTENPTGLDLPNKKRVSFTEHPHIALISDGDHTVTTRDEYHQPSQPSPNNSIKKDFLLNQSELLCVENERSEPHLAPKPTSVGNKSNSRGILRVKEKRTSWDELIQKCMKTLSIYVPSEVLLEETLKVFGLICYNEFFMGGCVDESCLLDHYGLPDITKWDWSSVWMATLYVIRKATKPKIEILKMLLKFISGRAPIFAVGLATCIAKMRQREQLEFAGCMVNHLEGFFGRETAVMLVLFISYPVVGTELFNILLVHLEVFENDSTIYLDLLNFLNFRIHVLPYTLVEKLIRDVLPLENNDLVGIVGEFLDRLTHIEKRKIMGTSLTRFMNKISECSKDEIESRKRLIGTKGSIDTKTENPTCLDLPNKKRVSFTGHPHIALISDGDHTVTTCDEYHQPSQPSPNNYIMKDFLLNQSELLCVENERSEPHLAPKPTSVGNKSNSRGILRVKEKRTSWDKLIQRCLMTLSTYVPSELLLEEALKVFGLICYNEFFMGGCANESCLLDHYSLPDITRWDWSSVWMATLYVIRMATKPKIEILKILVKFISGRAPFFALGLATCIPKMRQRDQLEFAGCLVNHLGGFFGRETAVMLILFISYPVVGTESFNILLERFEVLENDSTIYLDLLNFLNFRIHVLSYTLVEQLIRGVLSSGNNNLVGIVVQFLDRLPQIEKRKIMGTSSGTRFMNKINEFSKDEIDSWKRLIGTKGSNVTKTKNPTCLDLPKNKRVSFTEHPCIARISDGDHPVIPLDEYHQPSQPSPNHYIEMDLLEEAHEIVCLPPEEDYDIMNSPPKCAHETANSDSYLSDDGTVNRVSAVVNVFKNLCPDWILNGNCEKFYVCRSTHILHQDDLASLPVEQLIVASEFLVDKSVRPSLQILEVFLSVLSKLDEHAKLLMFRKCASKLTTADSSRLTIAVLCLLTARYTDRWDAVEMVLTPNLLDITNKNTETFLFDRELLSAVMKYAMVTQPEVSQGVFDEILRRYSLIPEIEKDTIWETCELFLRRYLIRDGKFNCINEDFMPLDFLKIHSFSHQFKSELDKYSIHKNNCFVVLLMLRYAFKIKTEYHEAMDKLYFFLYIQSSRASILSGMLEHCLYFPDAIRKTLFDLVGSRGLCTILRLLGEGKKAEATEMFVVLRKFKLDLFALDHRYFKISDLQLALKICILLLESEENRVAVELFLTRCLKYTMDDINSSPLDQVNALVEKMFEKFNCELLCHNAIVLFCEIQSNQKSLTYPLNILKYFETTIRMSFSSPLNRKAGIKLFWQIEDSGQPVDLQKITLKSLFLFAVNEMYISHRKLFSNGLQYLFCPLIKKLLVRCIKVGAYAQFESTGSQITLYSSMTEEEINVYLLWWFYYFIRAKKRENLDIYCAVKLNIKQDQDSLPDTALPLHFTLEKIDGCVQLFTKRLLRVLKRRGVFKMFKTLDDGSMLLSRKCVQRLCKAAFSRIYQHKIDEWGGWEYCLMCLEDQLMCFDL